MSIEADIVARLIATIGPGEAVEAEDKVLKLVEDAVSFGDLKAAPPQNLRPAAYVVPVAETAPPSRTATAITRQLVTADIGIVLCVGVPGDKHGAVAKGLLTTARTAVRGALLGWQPGSAEMPLEFVQGGLIGKVDTVLWWTDRYRTQFQIQG
jgi:hypothetical protein